jgi:hypothetical protein
MVLGIGPGRLLDTHEGDAEQLERLVLERCRFGTQRDGGEVSDQAAETVDWHAIIAAPAAALAFCGILDLGRC